MTLDAPEKILARRAADVAARPDVPDPLEEAIKRDQDRHRQLAARQRGTSPRPETKQGEPAAKKDDTPAADPREGYEVIQNGTWYSLIAPDGEKVGKSQRSEAEAWALLEEE